MYDLSGKVAIVTGAGAELGIGRAVVTRLAREGADVVVSDIVDHPFPELSPEWGGLPSRGAWTPYLQRAWQKGISFGKGSSVCRPMSLVESSSRTRDGGRWTASSST